MRSWMIPFVPAIVFGYGSFVSQTAVLRAQSGSYPTDHFVSSPSGTVLVAPSMVRLPLSDDSEASDDNQEENQPSPSDQRNSESAKELSTKASDSDTKNQDSSEDSAGTKEQDSSNSDLLAPVQNRQLTLKVQAVSIAHDKIGTGLVPTASRPQWSSESVGADSFYRTSFSTHVQWHASLISHCPLYFEDAMLERHGHTHCCRGWEVSQSLVSGAKFFGTIAFLPYLRTLQPKHECVYALGHYRAGSMSPCLRSNLPYDGRAAIVESASAAAFFWAAPL